MRIINLLLIIFSLFLLESCNSEKSIKKTWIKLKESRTEKEEIKAIKNLSSQIMKIEGYFSFYGITKTNDTLNITNQKHDSIKLNHINIKINWREHEFYGRNWKPINRENIYLFFRE